MLPKDLADLAALQDGVVTRRQALSAGLSVRQVEWRNSSGRWERVHAGVYQTQPGRRDQASAESAAILACGAGAVLSHWSVAHHLGLTRAAPKQIHVSVPSTRRVVEPLGVTVYRTVGAVDASESWQWPPRASDDQTVIDIAALGTADDAVAIAALACQRGVTWHEALRVERTTVAGIHDAGFDEQMVLVELDGLAFHTDASSRLSDTRRDRRSAGVGWLTIRVVWIDVALHQCTTALDIATVLSSRGWAERPRPCRRRECALRRQGR